MMGRHTDQSCLRLWAKKVKERDHYTCQICGGRLRKDGGRLSVLHAHHLVVKQRREYRHDIDNGICLCYTCHLGGYGQNTGPNGEARISAHSTPLSFYEELERRYPEQYELFAARRKVPVTKPGEVTQRVVLDYDEIYERLSNL